METETPAILTTSQLLTTGVTDQIVSELEKGVRPWLKPWNAEHAAGRITRPLRGNGIPYQGINVLMLWAAAVEKGYAAPIWMAFKQALDLKANVRRGEYGSLVVYADKIIRTETDSETGEESDCAIPFMKGYSVVNVEQIDGLPEHYYAKPEARTDSVQRIAHAESFFAATGANLVHGGSRACYVPSTDNIHMPCIDFFCDAESYYATLAHETTHNAEPRIMPRRPEFSRETRAESTGQCGIIGAMPVRQIDSKGVKAVASRRRM